jgi:hypothetical protein
MTLDEAERGMFVIYIPGHAHGDRKHKDCEHGVITSKNDANIFVRFRGSTSQACTPSDLVQLTDKP